LLGCCRGSVTAGRAVLLPLRPMLHVHVVRARECAASAATRDVGSGMGREPAARDDGHRPRFPPLRDVHGVWRSHPCFSLFVFTTIVFEWRIRALGAV
jgi:hypothetical protein